MSYLFLVEKPCEFFINELNERKLRRPLYSLRAFARDLNLSPSTLSDILKGRIGLSAARVNQISKALNLSKDQVEHLVDLFSAEFSQSTKTKTTAVIRIKSRQNQANFKLYRDQFEYISDWHHLAILELLALDSDFYNSKVKIAQALKLSQAKVSNSIKLLERLSLIVKHKTFYAPSESKTTVGDGLPSLAIQNFHRQFLNLSQKHLADEIATKHMTSAFLNLNKDDINDIKKDLDKFQEELFVKYYHKNKKNSLYGLSMQLFKLVDLDQEKENQNEKS